MLLTDLLQFIDSGAFGELWLGHRTDNIDDKVALKFEKADIAQPQLIFEYRIYLDIIKKYKETHNDEFPPGIPRL